MSVSLSYRQRLAVKPSFSVHDWIGFTSVAAVILVIGSAVGVAIYQSYLMSQIGHANPPEAASPVSQSVDGEKMEASL